MKRRRMHIDIMFHRIQPEAVLQTLLRGPYQRPPQLSATSRGIACETYLHYARPLAGGLSDDELENLFRDMEAMTHGPDGRTSVFLLLHHYTDDVLRLSGPGLVCRLEEVLNWRELSLQTGQDLLTTAHLAWHDILEGQTRSRFDWPAILSTDDPRLQEILRRGLSENHFHLNGSTQSFPLSWMCLMNYPERAGAFLRDRQIAQKMSENLQDTPNLSAADVHLSWERRLYLAAILRAHLFERCEQLRRGEVRLSGPAHSRKCAVPILSKFIHSFQPNKDASLLTERLRFQYGVRYRQPDGGVVCLDYAIAQPEQENAWRSLGGERNLLYRCLTLCFQGCFSPDEQDLFYLYLLLKAQFRSELIQVNRRVGFRNFSSYQDRKDDFFYAIPAYANEAIRLSVGAVLGGGNVRSLEVRCTPKETAVEDVQSILHMDAAAEFARTGKPFRRDGLLARTADAPYFYTLHFIKRKPEPSKQYGALGHIAPRGANVREDVRRRAEALAFALSQNEHFCRRIRGIDVASSEIGCRPEVFAQGFRFLRKRRPAAWAKRATAAGHTPAQLGITFHVGEDFLDLADGLRAIDEAVRFLNLQRGDRLGHALALGLDPEHYYQRKGRQIILPKQDYLDDLVWLIYRGEELGVTIPSNLRCRLLAEAEQLFHELYAPCVSDCISLLNYYQAWKLRGDAPERFRTGEFRKLEREVPYSYDLSGLAEGKELEFLRGQRDITRIYAHYHFGSRTAGEQIQVLQPEARYIQLVGEIQQQIQQQLVRRGICIECNPSSNVLIGTFERYENHPIFRFNHYQLSIEGASAPQLSVSVNTDDQGVFDTSLENEYALLAACLRWRPDGSASKYSDDQIYTYLDHIRELGNLQTFGRSGSYSGAQ